jgi:hypothetical protein
MRNAYIRKKICAQRRVIVREFQKGKSESHLGRKKNQDGSLYEKIFSEFNIKRLPGFVR